MKKYLLLILFAVQIIPLYAQVGQSDGELAKQYFSTGDFEKAVVYFDKYYDQDPFNAYPSFLKCLLTLKDYDKAEKLIKRQTKKFPNDLSVKVDLASMYETSGEKEKAKKIYSDLIKKLPADVNQVNMLANAFSQKQDFENAVQVLLQGRKLLGILYTFGFELADIYAQQGKFQEMTDEYLDLILYNSLYMQNVQTILQNKLSNDLSGNLSDLIRTSLLRRIQKSPDEIEFSELLYWFFLQEKDFESAFIQARGIDKRLSESGERILALGRLCVNNTEYDIAEKCYQYLLDKGPQSQLYVLARMELINAINEKVTSGGNYTAVDLAKLESDYEHTLNEIGKSTVTAPLIRGFAHLKAFYLHKSSDAISLLLETIELPQLSNAFKAECKLELGDIYVFTGELWEAALLYGQVDKDFKNETLGREAKYRNARLSYYLGEFDWAREQLNVLKAATSQLTSNDAISLSLLIMDNTNLDSTLEALLVFSRAELLAFQNQDSLAIMTLDSLLRNFPNHMLTDEAWYKKALIYKKTGQFERAIPFLKDIVEKYGEDILADDALYTEADLYENKLKDKVKAKELYETLITKYPGSLYVVEARKRFRNLRGDKLN